MAIYRNEARIIGRQGKDKAGKVIPGKQVSVVAKAAYRSGNRLKDERTGNVFDYRSRSQEILHSEIVAPETAPSWLSGGKEGEDRTKDRETRQRLWNTIEQAEKRKDSQLSREFILALPVELSPEENSALVRDWCKQEIASKGFVADVSLHASRDGKNPHAHVLMTLRPVEGEGFGKKPDMSGKFAGRGKVGAGAKADLADWRETWAKAENAALEQAGRPERVDHRSLADQGVDRIPQPKVGVQATAMERKGIPTERNERVIWNKMDNMALPSMRGIEQTGEVPQVGTGNSWWERAQVAIGRSWAQAGEFLRDESSGARRPTQSDDSLRRSAFAGPSASWEDFVSNKLAKEQERGSPELGFG